MIQKDGILVEGVEIFSTGVWNGENYSETDLDELATYDPEFFEAPVTTDHKKEGPAWGWIKRAYRKGSKLLSDVIYHPKFFDAYQQGLYAKPSIEFQPNFKGLGKKYLKAVTYLGAKAPELTGLAGMPDPLTFSDPTFDQNVIVGSQTIDDPKIQNKEKKKMAEVTFTEDQVNRLVESAGIKAKSEVSQEFSAKLAAKETEIRTVTSERDALKTENVNLKASAEKIEIATFCEGLIKDQKLTPAEKDKTVDHLSNLAKLDAASFASEKAILNARPKIVKFGEEDLKGADKGGEDYPKSYSFASDSGKYAEKEGGK